MIIQNIKSLLGVKSPKFGPVVKEKSATSNMRVQVLLIINEGEDDYSIF